MEDFLTSVERKAFRMAVIGVGQEADAHDLVQETMLRFVDRYANKPRQEWPALFYRILQNQITDFYRRRQVRTRLFSWFRSEDDEENPIDLCADPGANNPEHLMKLGSACKCLEQELKKLPLRQQQTVMLRAWEGLSVAETAIAMRCTEGTVKTHYARALERLRRQLGEEWP